MNRDVDESKGHFDELQKNLGPLDLLLVLIWCWKPIDRGRVSPFIVDQYIGSARSIAVLRDKLHLARGGTFVTKSRCPNGCLPGKCPHDGEPLNANGKRERSSGPDSCKPQGSSFAANFGGLIRMLKTSSSPARATFNQLRASDEEAHAFISFVHRNFPAEEENSYPARSWRQAAAKLGLSVEGLSRREMIDKVRALTGYMEVLRVLEQ